MSYYQEIDELIDDWVPEPLVSEQTPAESIETERIPVIVGYVQLLSPTLLSLLPFPCFLFCMGLALLIAEATLALPDPSRSSPTAAL